MKLSTKLAYHTLVWSWTVKVLAAIAVVFHIFVNHKYRNVALEEGLNILAWICGVALVIQSTWAIVDEGQAEHQKTLSTSQVSRAAKVGFGAFNVISKMVTIGS